MADFGDFLTGFTGSLYQQRKDDADRKAESDEYVRRQKLLADLDVEKKGRMNALEKKDGNTFKDESGNWVTEQLDGGGNPVGTRKATAAEIAEVESKTLDVEDKRDQLNYRPTARAMEAEQHQADMDYKKGSLDLQRSSQALARERLNWERARMEAQNQPASGAEVIENYLLSPEGKMVVSAYTNTMGRGLNSRKPDNKYGQVSEEEQLQIAYNQLKSQIVQKLAQLPPERRPKTERELRQLVQQIAAQHYTQLDGAASSTVPLDQRIPPRR